MRRLEIALRRLPESAAFSGLTAAWLHGLDVEPCNPIEATVSKHAGISGRAHIALRRSELDGDDITRARGMPATSVARTISDLCAKLSLVEAVVISDAALHHGLTSVPDLKSWAESNRRRHGIRSLRRVTCLAEPAAESPMESRLRMLLVLSRLPRPKAQVEIYDSSGRFAGRVDLYYPEHGLAIEYDGAIHRDSLVQDSRRQNTLIGAGVTLLRFTGADVLGKPDAVVNQVRSFLRRPSPQARSL